MRSAIINQNEIKDIRTLQLLGCSINKVRAYLEEADPEAAAEIAHKEELKMAEERLRLRHGGHKKWARDMRRFKGKMEDTETREQYHEMMREKNALKDR